MYISFHGTVLRVKARYGEASTAEEYGRDWEVAPTEENLNRDGVRGVLSVCAAGARVQCVAHKPDASVQHRPHRYTDPVLFLYRDISLSISYITDRFYKSVTRFLNYYMNIVWVSGNDVCYANIDTGLH